MPKPTPAQARILRALDQHPYARVLWNGRQAAAIGPDGWKVQKQLEDEGVRLRSPSLRIITRRGWLEPEEEGSSAYRLSQAGRAALKQLDEDDFETPVPDFTALEIHQALQSGFYGDLWAYFREVTIDDWQTTRRIDALVFRISAPHELHAIEIKVDRGDFLHELDDHTKRLPAQELTHCFCFAAPAGLIKDHELPDGCGLLEVHGVRTVVEKVEPEYTRAERPTWSLFAALMRARERTVA